jgi:serine/threonine protein kinase
MDCDIKVKLGKRLGAGAFGDVYKAQNLRSGEAVAVKVIKPDKQNNDPMRLTRVKREVEAMGNLKHVSLPSPSQLS